MLVGDQIRLDSRAAAFVGIMSRAARRQGGAVLTGVTLDVGLAVNLVPKQVVRLCSDDNKQRGRSQAFCS